MNEQKEFRLFLLTDYEKEEAYLRARHQQGLRLTKAKLPGMYYFEPCEPKDVIYRLDFNPQSAKDRVDYINRYREQGWEYLQDLNDYSYFRKDAKDVECDGDVDFANDTARVGMLRKLFKRRLLLIMVIFLLCVLPNVMKIADGTAKATWGTPIYAFWIIMFVIYAGILLRCLFGFYYLYRKYFRKK